MCNICQRVSSSALPFALLQHDPEGQWGTLKLTHQEPEEEEEEGALPTVATKFPHCLIDATLVVRLFMARSMKRSVRLIICSVYSTQLLMGMSLECDFLLCRFHL